jgi:molybdate transport system regulatory protein
VNIVNHPRPAARIATHRIRFDQALADPMTDRRVEILRAIGQSGSISEAARLSRVSYKAAWQAIETLGHLAGVTLIEKTVGGSGGGGTRLTKAGLQLLEGADALTRAREQALAKLDERSAEHSRRSAGRGVLGLRTSLRNQLPGEVISIRRAVGAVRVMIRLPDGQTIAARITAESRDLLGLARGTEVIALFKATAVTVVCESSQAPELNRLAGHVIQRVGSRSGAQLSMALGAGLRLAGFGAPDRSWRARDPAMAVFDESTVIVALPE